MITKFHNDKQALTHLTHFLKLFQEEHKEIIRTGELQNINRTETALTNLKSDLFEILMAHHYEVTYDGKEIVIRNLSEARQ